MSRARKTSGGRWSARSAARRSPLQASPPACWRLDWSRGVPSVGHSAVAPHADALSVAAGDQRHDRVVTDEVAERLDAVADKGRLGQGAHRGRAVEAEQWTHLSDVIARQQNSENLWAFGRLSDGFQFAAFDEVDQVTRITLLEQRRPGLETDRPRCLIGRRDLRAHLDDLIGERQTTGLLRGHEQG